MVSDIHADIEALNAILPVIDAQNVDKIICLGDMVGYYTNPNECLEIIEQREMVCIAGNHDRGAVLLKALNRFGKGARLAMPWTQKHLTPKSKLFLEQLPVTKIVDDSFMMVHSSLDPHPDTDFYIRSEQDALPTFNALLQEPSNIKICFFGHTHHPLLYEYNNGEIRKITETTTFLNPSCYYLINPGSVGQSRDYDDRASFAIYDTQVQTISFFRVAYDRTSCLQKAKKAGILYKKSGLSKQWKNMKMFAKESYPVFYGFVRNIVRSVVPFE
jgi:predicted phosphodiesterase